MIKQILFLLAALCSIAGYAQADFPEGVNTTTVTASGQVKINSTPPVANEDAIRKDYLETQLNTKSNSNTYSSFSPTKTIASGGWNGFPSITKNALGELLLIYRKATHHDIIGNGKIVYKKSTDNGYTFGSEITILSDANPDIDYRDACINKLSTGELIISYFRHTAIVGGINEVYTIRSTNNGSTWSTPVQLVSYADYSAVSAPVIELANGDLLLPTYGKDGANWKTNVYKSTNKGVSWSYFSTITSETYVSPGVHYAEPEIALLANGNIIATIRNQATNKTAISTSTNSGATWSAPVDKFDSRSRANITVTSFGRLIFSFRNYNANEASFGLIPAFNFSDDNGTTFSDPVYTGTDQQDGLFWQDVYSGLAPLGQDVFAYTYALENSTDITKANVYFKYVNANYSVSRLQSINAKGIYNTGDFRQIGNVVTTGSVNIDNTNTTLGLTVARGKTDGFEVGVLGTPNFLVVLNAINRTSGLYIDMRIAAKIVSINQGPLVVGSTVDSGSGAKLQVTGNTTGTGTASFTGTVSGGVATASTHFPQKLYVDAQDATKAPINNAVFTGDTQVATPATSDNDTSVPTTAWVKANAIPYKVYTAILTQTGTAAPTATVLENTLGTTITWTRTGTGAYTGTAASAVFTANKTFLNRIQSPSISQDVILIKTSTTVVNITTSNSSGVVADTILSNGGVDGNSCIEIRVYN